MSAFNALNRNQLQGMPHAPRDTNLAAAAIFERIATRNEAQELAIFNAMTVMSGGKYKPAE